MTLFAGLCALLLWLCAPAQALAHPPLSAAAAELQRAIAQTANNRDLPYLIIDKRAARIWIYDRRGRLIESAAVLLGSAVGDHSVAGIGLRPLHQIRPAERTTPAGRFLLEAGRNSAGEDIFWLDYEAALSLHRVRANVASERRLQRLASASAADNRISYGCVNLPAAVYERSVYRLFSASGGYAYVLPEVQEMRRVFPFVPSPALRPHSLARPGSAGPVVQPRSARAGRELPLP